MDVTGVSDAAEMGTQTLIERHRANPAKAGGVVYTPPALARFLAAQAFDAYEGVGPVSILDPACGDGELLVAAVAEAGRRKVRVEAVVGYDIDADAVERASTRLAETRGVQLHVADFIAQQAKCSRHRDLFDMDRPIESLGFDLVISNPPYVRTQTLGSDHAQSLGKRYGLTGRVDLYQVFAAAMIQALAPGGAIGLLCSNKFLTNRAGSSMRRLLLNELVLRELVDLGDTKLFEAAVLPVIVSGVRAPLSEKCVEAPRFRAVYEVKPDLTVSKPKTTPVLEALRGRVSGLIEDSGRTFAIREGLLDGDAGPDRPWNPVDEETRRQFEVLRRSETMELGSVGKIRVGIKTTADSVFVRSDWSHLPDDLRPEQALIRPLLTHQDIEPWSAVPGQRQILYPYQSSDGRATPVDLSSFPRTAAYLEQHRDQLAGRKYVVDAGRQWFEIWVPQRPSLWARPKVVFPDIADEPRFAFDSSGAIVNGDCYWVIIEDEDLAEVVTAVGNSSFCTWFYDRACGNFLYAGRRRFMTQYMERLPIPKPSPGLADEFRAMRRENAPDHLDALVWSSLGLEQIGR